MKYNSYAREGIWKINGEKQNLQIEWTKIKSELEELKEGNEILKQRNQKLESNQMKQKREHEIKSK